MSVKQTEKFKTLYILDYIKYNQYVFILLPVLQKKKEHTMCKLSFLGGVKRTLLILSHFWSCDCALVPLNTSDSSSVPPGIPELALVSWVHPGIPGVLITPSYLWVTLNDPNNTYVIRNVSWWYESSLWCWSNPGCVDLPLGIFMQSSFGVWPQNFLRVLAFFESPAFPESLTLDLRGIRSPWLSPDDLDISMVILIVACISGENV